MIMMMDGHDICEQTPAASGDEDVIIIRVLLMNYVYSLVGMDYHGVFDGSQNPFIST